MGIVKEYRKLTSEEFQGFVQMLPEIRKGEREFREIASQRSREEIARIYGADRNWAAVYECSFAEHLALLFVALDGGREYLAEVARDPNPQARLLADIDADALDFDLDHYKGGYKGLFSREALFGLCFSLQRTVLSIMLFQRSMSALVQEVRESDNLDSLFDAVRVDRSALACPTIAARVAHAEVRSDTHFFLRLRNALKGPRQKHWESYKDLRYSLFVLRELGFDKLSDDELEQLLVHTLKVYPDRPSARKNLRRQYQLSRKIKTI